MELTCDRGCWYEDSDGFWFAARTKDRAAAARISQEMDGKPWTIEAKPQRKKRSLDANSYMWSLLDKLAIVLGTTKENLYRLKVQRYGIFRDFHLPPDEADTFKVAWSKLGTGWLTEQVDYTKDGNQVVIRAYYGSSQYNTKQMSRLIESIVQDCKEQDIETMTPVELAGMMEAWHG